ncbi:MAG: DUF3574 domain-containing protein [Methylobacteriaceae bacterium]|nr:DUF3574 domain-containing protein [Methylobacteriaceae bacterium]
MRARSALAVYLLALVAPASAQTACPASLRPWTRIELHVGLGLAGGGEVSRAQFRNFLETTVTPRFPEGYTVIEATGHYRYKSGKVAAEPARVLVILTKAPNEAAQKVDEIVRIYKTRFRQESVGRAQRIECATFD